MAPLTVFPNRHTHSALHAAATTAEALASRTDMAVDRSYIVSEEAFHNPGAKRTVSGAMSHQLRELHPFEVLANISQKTPAILSR